MLSDMALEQFWVIQSCWISLCTTVDMYSTINNLCKLFCYGVQIDHYEKIIGIRDFLELIALDCFNTPFSNYTGIPVENIPLLDEVDELETVSNYCSLPFSGSIYPSTETSTISDINHKTDSSISYTLVNYIIV